jgi:hypothetical protein
MKPVVTALHAIAAIECETREAQKEAASAGRSETILSRDLSQSSLASGNDRHGPDAPFAYREAIRTGTEIQARRRSLTSRLPNRNQHVHGMDKLELKRKTGLWLRPLAT